MTDPNLTHPSDEPVSQLPEARYIAGLGPVGDDGEIQYMVYLVLEETHDGKRRRVGGPYEIIPPLTKPQAEHLHLQIGNAIGNPQHKALEAVRAAYELAVDDDDDSWGDRLMSSLGEALNPVTSPDGEAL